MGNETHQIKKGFTYKTENCGLRVRSLEDTNDLGFFGIVTKESFAFCVGSVSYNWTTDQFTLDESVPEYDLLEELPEDVKREESMLDSMAEALSEHMEHDTKKLWEKFQESLHQDLAKKF